MHSALTKEEIMQWRRSTEKITLEEYAQRLGKLVQEKKETNDLHDILLKKQENPQIEEEIKVITTTVRKEVKEAKVAAINEIAKKAVEQAEKFVEKAQKPDFELKVNFKKKLNKREEIVFSYFCQNRKQKVSVNDLANLLELPNDYVYKYIKNLRSKLAGNMLVNTDGGGYMLNA